MKEIDRYVRWQNETQEGGEENTNPLHPSVSFVRLLEQQAPLHASAVAVPHQQDEQAGVPREPTSAQPSNPLGANPSMPTTLSLQQASVPNAAAENTQPHQTQRRWSASEEAAEIAARRQRLLALQQELAQLKRSPSMQLLARQRIPRLEEAIKQLITELQESA